MRNLCALLALAFVLPACAPDPAPVQKTAEAPSQPAPGVIDPPLPPIPMAADAGLSGQDSLTWFFDNHGRNGAPRLMYSARGSDEMALNLQCRTPGTVTALIVRAATEPKPATWPFTLTSGAEKLELQGAVAAEGDLFVIEAEMPDSAPVLAALHSSGQLSIEDASHVSAMPLNAINDAERAEIGRFLAAC
jgi:hypothetical protein